MIDKSIFKFDLSKLASAIACLPSFETEIEVTSPDPASTEGRWDFVHCDIDSYIVEVARQIQLSMPPQYTTNRMRAIRVGAGRAIRLPEYAGMTYYIPVVTNPGVMFSINTGDGGLRRVKEGNLPMVLTYQLDADGCAYVLDGTKFHTITNTGNENAAFLVVETNQPKRDKLNWTGLTAERLTGHEDFLEVDLRDGDIFAQDRE